jgi:hypothetical protein
MPGKGVQGRNSLVPRRQCKPYMVKAELPEAQSNRRPVATTAQGELKSRARTTEEKPIDFSVYPGACRSGYWSQLFWAAPSPRGINGRKGHLSTAKLNHVEMQDCLSWCTDLVQSPVWQRSPNSTQRLPVMGLAAKSNLDQPRYKTVITQSKTKSWGEVGQS